MGNQTACYDYKLGLEAFRFKGMKQEFPNHSHDHYVIGFVEKSRRIMTCRGRERCIIPGDVILFAPGENHSCRQMGDDPLDYRCINLKGDVMIDAMRQTMGVDKSPVFKENVLSDKRVFDLLKELHCRLSEGSSGFREEEFFLSLVAKLIEICHIPPRPPLSRPDLIQDQGRREFHGGKLRRGRVFRQSERRIRIKQISPDPSLYRPNGNLPP